jgi:hypothetical protein
MSFFKKKSIKLWLAVNRNEEISLHCEKPEKDEVNGIWVSKYPYVNSVIYGNLSKMIEKSMMSWTSSPEFFEINLQ